MAQIEAPAPAERIAVLEISDEPGKASINACAFFAGSSAGTLEACRVDVRVVAKGGRTWEWMAGRSLAAPIPVNQARHRFPMTTNSSLDSPTALRATRDAIVMFGREQGCRALTDMKYRKRAIPYPD